MHVAANKDLQKAMIYSLDALDIFAIRSEPVPMIKITDRDGANTPFLALESRDSPKIGPENDLVQEAEG
jgi:hypothetical protein